MPSYYSLGKIPRKRHTIYRKPDGNLYAEQLVSTEGFSGTYSLTYHCYPPTRVLQIGESYSVDPDIAEGNNMQHRSFFGLNVEPTDDWDVAVEVCFYRDYLWHKGKPVHGSGFSPKRTFDLCLFSSNTIIIIEAKVDQPFDTEQNKVFAEDSKKIRQLLGNEDLNIYLVALASSKYYKADANNGSGDALRPFNGRISWSDMYQEYVDEIFNQAENLYGSDKHKLIS